MDAWPNLHARLGELDALGGAMALLDWDQQTYLPAGAGEARGRQASVLARIAHERLVGPEVGDWLDQLAGAPLDEVKAAAVRNLRRRYRRATVVPGRLVEELSAARSEGFTRWVEAKERDDFAVYAASLQRLIDLTRELAACLAEADPVAHPYDALLAEYDPGSTVAELQPMFARLSRELNVLLAAVAGRPQVPALDLDLDVAGQRKLSARLLRDLGFDLQRGRIDDAEHPFSSGLHTTDVRLTTHFFSKDVLGGIGSTVHECGHGMYEQGLPTEWAGTGLDRAAGYGLHESQSRFWENFVGRSLPFCRYLVPRMQGIWPDLTLTPEALYAACNRVERSLVRIYADEATYNLHIVARFEVELGILEGRLQAADLPDAWDDAYARNVGLRPPSRKLGVLQDVHWSGGAFGYFPSYTIGNLYAASLAATMAGDLPGMWADVEAGRFGAILGWLRERIHRRGHFKDAPDLIRDAVGDRDPVGDLVDHLWARHGALYGVVRPA